MSHWKQEEDDEINRNKNDVKQHALNRKYFLKIA